MDVCPNCRAGKEYISWERVEEYALTIVNKHTCGRCEFTKKERIKQ